MNSQQMRDFDYLHYLQTVLKSESTQALYIATEKDFDRGQGIPFPYRSYFYAFGIIHEGERRFRIGFREFQLKERSLTIVGPGILRCWLDQNWSVKTTTLFFTAALFQQTLHAQALAKYKFFQPNAQHVLDLTGEQYQDIIRFTQLLEHHRHNQAICGGVVFALLEYIAELYPVLSANESEIHAH